MSIQSELNRIASAVSTQEGIIGQIKTALEGIRTGRPTLHAVSISISGDTLTITNPATNGDFVDGYRIYANNNLIATVSSTTVNLSQLLVAAGTYAITAKAYGAGFIDSAASNSATYVVLATYTITAATTNVTASASNPNTIIQNGTATLTFTAASGYELPASVSVTGATGAWTQENGTLVLSNPTGNVSFSVVGVMLPQLSAPTNVTANGTTISFDPVEHAESYKVYADNVLIGEVEA